MTVQLSPLVHMNAVVRDAEAAAQFLYDALGAKKIKEPVAGPLTSARVKVVPVGLGDMIIRFIEPRLKEGPWYEHLQTKGPGVHSLGFFVSDLEAALQTLAADGVKPKFELSGQAPDHLTYTYLDTRDRIGFDLELAPAPAGEPVEAGRPRYATGLDRLVGRVSPLLHVELTVPNIEATYEFLHRLFGSELVEIEFAEFLDHARTHIVHMNLGNVVLQYCQPLVQQSPKTAHLAKGGPAVHNITFLVPSMNDAMQALHRAGAKDLFAFPLDWGKLIGPDKVRADVAPVHMVDTMDRLGFHLELGERPSDEPLDFLFIDFE